MRKTFSLYPLETVPQAAPCCAEEYTPSQTAEFDLTVVGGGINGTGIARSPRCGRAGCCGTAWPLHLRSSRRAKDPARNAQHCARPRHAGGPLRRTYAHGFEYSDCWADDARLVVLNAVDAAERGAVLRTRTRCIGAERGKAWRLVLDVRGRRDTATARVMINATGPWLKLFADSVLHQAAPVTAGRANQLALKGAYRPVTVREGEKLSSRCRQSRPSAAKSNGPAQRALIELIQAIERELTAQATAKHMSEANKPPMSDLEVARRNAFLLSGGSAPRR